MSIGIGEIIDGANTNNSESELLLGLFFYFGNIVESNKE
jgi:hypothetical protein